VEPNLILDAIYNQSKTPRVDIRYRGYLGESTLHFLRSKSLILLILFF